MPTYIVLHEFSQENIQNMDAQREAGMEALEDLGGELQGLWVTFGQYDAVGVVDFPDDTAAATWLLSQAEQTGLSTETLKAIPVEEANEIIANLSD